MKIEIHEKESNAAEFEELEFGAIFRFGSTIMMKVYDSNQGVSCGLGVNPNDCYYMETCDIDETTLIYEIYADSKLIVQ